MSLRLTQNVADAGVLIGTALLLLIVASLDAGANASQVSLYLGGPFAAIALGVMLLHARERLMRAEENRVLAVSRSVYRSGPRQLSSARSSYRQDSFGHGQNDYGQSRYYDRG